MIPRLARASARCGLHQKSRAFSAHAMVELPKVDWDDWLEQFADVSREAALQNVVTPLRAEEGKTLFNPKDLVEVDFEEWKKVIKSPGVVELLQAEYDATDCGNYGEYWTDDLTPEARQSLIDKKDDEITLLGVDKVEAGMKKTFDQNAKEALSKAAEKAQAATHWLEELYKDKEQLEAEIRNFSTRTPLMEFAEHPEMARECDEFMQGVPEGLNGALQPWDFVQLSEIEKDLTNPERHDDIIEARALRESEATLEEMQDEMELLGIDFDVDSFCKGKREIFDSEIAGLRDHVRDTYNVNTDEREPTHEWVHVAGSG